MEFGDIMLVVSVLVILYLILKKLRLPSDYLGGGCGISKKHLNLLRESMHERKKDLP